MTNVECDAERIGARASHVSVHESDVSVVPGDQPLKVVQIVPSISLVYGGPSQMARGFSQALAQQGAEVTVLTTDANGDTGQAPLEVPLNYPVEQDGYQIRYFRCVPFRRYKFSLGLLRWFYHHAHEFDIAHIHALFSPVSSVAAAIARHRHLPYILRPLGTLDPADLRKKRVLKRCYAACLERHNMAGAAALHFTSLQEAKVSERFDTQTPSLIIPLGVTPSADPTRAKNHAENQTPTQPTDGSAGSHSVPCILFMSRIDPKKGLDLLIPALERVLTEGQNFRFILAGANPQDLGYEQWVRDRIQSSAIAPYTTMTGFVQGDPKNALLQQADLFVLPSYYENFGIAVAEAMVAGIPVLVSDQVHICDDIQRSQSGWVCACDVDSLTTQLLQALQNSSLRQQRGDRAQQFALIHYSWGAIAQRTLTVYQDILSRQSSSITQL